MAFLKVDQPIVNFQHKPNNTDFEALTLVNHKDSTGTKDLFVKQTLICGPEPDTHKSSFLCFFRILHQYST
jgi:hypothetical protein